MQLHFLRKLRWFGVTSEDVVMARGEVGVAIKQAEGKITGSV